MKAVELTELPEATITDDSLIPVVNPDGTGRATLKEVRGLGLSGQETFFLATASASGVTAGSEGWQDVPQATTADKRYLWSYIRFTYTDGKVVTTPPAIVGVYGDTGDKGDKGDKGDTGKPFVIAKTYPSIQAMETGYATDGVDVGAFVVIDTGSVEDPDNGRLYLKGDTAYQFIVDLSGIQGLTGPQGPKGDKGDKGDRGESAMEGFIDVIYPVGSLYWSSRNVNPSTWLGGTWEQIKDKFVLAAGDIYTNGDEGGNAEVTLTVDNLPSHTHTITRAKANHNHNTTIIEPCSYNEGDYDWGFFTASQGGFRAREAYTGEYAPPDYESEQTGNNTPFSNMPPYLVAYCWERTA